MEENKNNVEEMKLNSEEVKEEKVEESTEEKVEEKKEESFIYRLDEMIDAIENSIQNMEKVLRDQHDLINDLTTLNKEKYDDLIKSMEKQNANIEEQLETLKIRQKYLLTVTTACRDNELYVKLVDATLLGLGIFKNN